MDTQLALPGTDKYTVLLNQALASVPKDGECFAWLQKLAKRRRAGQGFTEAETAYLEAVAKDPKAPCNPPNDIGVTVVAVAVVAVPIVLAILFNFQKGR
jgi:hypothetical protein